MVATRFAGTADLKTERRRRLAHATVARRHGPPLAPWNYWHARTRMLVWMLPRALRSGQWRQALSLAVGAFVLNPLWWVKPEPWTLIWRTCTTGVAEVLGLRRGSAPGG